MGRIAEELWREEMRDTGMRFGIPDGYVIQPDDLQRPHAQRVCLVEIKAAEHFEEPPWDGHGLDAEQADRYMETYRLTGIRTRLIIYDPDGWRYSAWLDDLERGETFTTGGTVKKPRRVYPLTNFRPEERPDLKTRLAAPLKAVS